MKSKVEKAIILAAGMGTRLGSLTDNLPKCLLQVGGKSILGSQLECLEKNGIKETAIVVGYMKDKIISQIGNQFGRMKIVYVENNIFDKTNNIYSLWLAQDYLDEGCLLLEGDLLFGHKLIERLRDAPGANVAVLDIFRKPMEGTVVALDSRGIVSKMFLKKDQTLGFDYQDKFKTVNIYKFSPAGGEKFSACLNICVRGGQVHDFYEMALRDLVLARKITLYGLVISELKWFEIDTAEDLETARRLMGQK